MADTVFILGAGASFEAGAPLMSNFLDVADDLMYKGAVNRNLKSFKNVFHMISNLQLVHAKSFLDTYNIEDLFGAIEMARIIKNLNGKSIEEIEELRNDLITVISQTLSKCISFPFIDNKIKPPQTYQNFVSMIEKMEQKPSIITFNYDIALDYTLLFNHFNIDYCLHENSNLNYSPITNTIRLLKLHGSLNWGKCKKCSEIVDYNIGSYLSNMTQYRPIWDERIYISPNDQLSHLKHCDEALENVPVLVPPSWNKTEYHGSLTNVWRYAAQELSEARNIIIIGYSLPESDSFFRYLFSLGTMGPSRIKQLLVYNPDNSGLVEGRYNSLVGRGIANRFEYIKMPFSKSINDIRDKLGLK